MGMHVMKFHAFHAFYISKICVFGPFLGKKTDKIGQFKKIGGEKGRKSVNYLKIKEEVICRNSTNKKKGEKVSILEKFMKRLFVRTVPPKKKEKKCQFLKSLGRGYLSEQSQQKKGEKVAILEKVRKRLFVGTVPTKKGEKVSILEKFRKMLFVGTVPPKKKEKKCKFWK